MDRLSFLLSASLGAAFILLYAFGCWKREEQVDVAVLANIVLQCCGIVAGSFLILSTIFPDLKSDSPAWTSTASSVGSSWPPCRRTG